MTDDTKITFTREEVEILQQARNILSDKYDEAHISTVAYYMMKPAYFAIDEAIDEIMYRSNYELDNSI